MTTAPHGSETDLAVHELPYRPPSRTAEQLDTVVLAANVDGLAFPHRPGSSGWLVGMGRRDRALRDRGRALIDLARSGSRPEHLELGSLHWSRCPRLATAAHPHPAGSVGCCLVLPAL